VSSWQIDAAGNLAPALGLRCVAMCKRLLIAAGVIALASVLVLLIPRQAGSPITLQVIGKTNIAGRAHSMILGEYLLVEITNHTSRLYNINVWAECRAVGCPWSQQNLSKMTRVKLSGHRDQVITVLLPRQWKRRVTLSYAQEDTLVRYWLRHARMLLGMQAFEGSRLYVEVE
jgi:hypothetical protein